MTRSPTKNFIRGSGNVFADLDRPNAAALQIRAAVAAEIIKCLDDKGMTARMAAECTGISAADFSRIRHAKLGRFTIDRLVTILERLDQRIDVGVTISTAAVSEAVQYV